MNQVDGHSHRLRSVSILHTNDMHGRLDAMARLSTFSRQIRRDAAAEGCETLLWDAGDAADRSIQICGATKGALFPGILNAMGYTLQAMGNAISLTYGPQAMAKIGAGSSFPILAANCRDGEGPLIEGIHEFQIIPLQNGLTMGVIGLTSPLNGVYEDFGLHLPDFVLVARRLVSTLREQGASVIIVLSHLGLPDDRKLADEVDGIDVIIGAHTHDRLERGEERNGVLIAQAGHYAQAIGRVDLSLDVEYGRVASKKARVLDVPSDMPPDPAVVDAIKAAEQELSTILAEKIGEISDRLDVNYYRECGLGDLAADALRDRMKADAAMIAGGQFRADIPAGELTLGVLDAACFSTANPFLSEVPGTQILDALERGLDPAINTFKHHGLRGAPIGIPQISGMVVEYARNAPTGPRVRHVLVNGEPLDPGRSYRVAHTDMEIVPKVGYLVLEEKQTLTIEVPTILREVLADYVLQHSPVPLPCGERWIAVEQP